MLYTQKIVEGFKTCLKFSGKNKVHIDIKIHIKHIYIEIYGMHKIFNKLKGLKNRKTGVS